MVAEGRGQKPDAVAARAENLISLLKDCYPRPLQISRINRDIFSLHGNFQPIIEPADHDGTYRSHSRDLFALALAPFQSSFDGFRHCDALRKREADGGIDADAFVGRFFNCRNSGSSRRNLHDHVWRQAAKLLRLPHNGVCVAIEPRVSLNRKSSITSPMFFKY